MSRRINPCVFLFKKGVDLKAALCPKISDMDNAYEPMVSRMHRILKIHVTKSI